MTYTQPFDPEAAAPQPILTGGAAYGPKHLTSAARRKLVKWSIVLAVALVVMVFALRSVHSTNATCAGHKMRRGDICVMNNGSRNSYSEQVAGERRSAWIFAAISALVVARSVQEAGRVIRRR